MNELSVPRRFVADYALPLWVDFAINSFYLYTLYVSNGEQSQKN